MSKQSVTHATFTIERTYAASPAQVFTAWADPEAKLRWFAPPAEWTKAEHSVDFRVGGEERLSVSPTPGLVHRFEGRYQDIVENQRIILSYDMHVGDKRISVSLVTVELLAEGDRTRLVFTEQDAFLDGLDGLAEREAGTRALLDNLGNEVERQAARVD